VGINESPVPTPPRFAGACKVGVWLQRLGKLRIASVNLGGSQMGKIKVKKATTVKINIEARTKINGEVKETSDEIQVPKTIEDALIIYGERTCFSWILNAIITQEQRRLRSNIESNQTFEQLLSE
jgi:hypothetical protein